MATRQPTRSAGARTQRGGVAVIVGLSAAVLAGFMGIALDVGRLYLNKTELQTAADACALAAAAQLTCDATGGTCPPSFLLNARAAGVFAAFQNTRDFQVNPVTIAPDDVKFHTALAPNSSYLAISGGALPNSKYAMCTARSGGIAPWFMAAVGAGALQTVVASGVATRSPSKSFCNAAPLGLCTKAGGYVVGEWITGSFTSAGNSDNTAGSFRWVDFTPNAGGANEVRDQFAGSSSVCGIQVGNNVQEPGTQQGVKTAYNTRFGMYPNGANAYTAATAPPDHSGYAYPNKAPGSPVIAIPTGTPPVGTAYDDYRARQNANTPFISNQYGVSGAAGNIAGNASTSAQHAAGADRRLVAAPLIDCAGGNIVPIIGMACVLLLNPMSNGASGTMFVEYRGLATAPASPCSVGGGPGGPASTGPQVPTLVQ